MTKKFMKNLISIFIVSVMLCFFTNQVNAQGSSVNETGTPADSSAMLDVSSTDKGMLIPRMTSSQREQISNPANGLIIYNTEENRLEIYNTSTTSWQYYSNTIVSIPLFICGERFIDSRDGQSYATTQIGDQCWMAENLSVGVKIDGTIEMIDNGIIEKYCYDNSNCATYGGLYQWDEIMQYSTIEGSQGICPDGWHLPSNEDWCILEDYADSGEIICPGGLGTGTDAGTNLKSFTGWYSSVGGNDIYGYNVLPGGRRQTNGLSAGLSNTGYFWSSTSDNDTTATHIRLTYSVSQIVANLKTKTEGLSVRCLKTE